jgi:hypothetical protein
LDTNVFLQSKNFEYRFDFCVAFWDWIKVAHTNGLLYSCSKVHQELIDGDSKKTCPARKWADSMPATFFLADTNNPAVMLHYGSLMNWATKSKQYTSAAVKEFAGKDEADAFVVAVAKHHGLTLVTHEKPAASAKARIPIHSAAQALGVKVVRLYDLLSLHAGQTFVYRP